MRWKDAWEKALYGDDGFFRREAPADHFRTSVTASGLFAGAIWRLIQAEGLGAVVDVGAGRGELLRELHRLSGGSLRLTGIEKSTRPGGLPAEIGWHEAMPDTVDGLLIAHEWLDNIACDVVEVDEEGTRRLVDVDPATGEESLGATVPVEQATTDWLDRWWPLDSPGERAEIGETRDAVWLDAASRVNGIALAIDYGHVADDRPPFGSVRSYRQGKEVDVIPDGSCDVTAHVAVDSLAAATASLGVTSLERQQDALRALGVTGARPSLDLAESDPRGYVRELSQASLAAELLAGDGWGNFWWIRVDTRGRERPA